VRRTGGGWRTEAWSEIAPGHDSVRGGHSVREKSKPHSPLLSREAVDGWRPPRKGGSQRLGFSDVAGWHLPAELRTIEFNGGDVAWGTLALGQTSQARSGPSVQR
jgi:hypothetical protein